MEIEVLNNSELATIIKSEIDVQISTAKAYPRSIKMFIDAATSMATMNEDIASMCSYSLPRGGKNIEGNSVRLAEICCSAYGNIRSGARVIANDGKTITAQGVCHDLQTNNCVTVEVKRSILDRNGKTYKEDMQVVTGNAACAIAFRNAVFKVIPSVLVSEIADKAKKVSIGTYETLAVRRDAAINYFKELGVKEKNICTSLGLLKIEDIQLNELGILRGMVTALKNNETTIDELFPREIDPDELQILFLNKQGFLSENVKSDIERILSSKEEASYKKALNILNNATAK